MLSVCGSVTRAGWLPQGCCRRRCRTRPSSRMPADVGASCWRRRWPRARSPSRECGCVHGVYRPTAPCSSLRSSRCTLRARGGPHHARQRVPAEVGRARASQVVVDSGLCRAPRFNAGTGLTQLHVTPISQASATQRAGRAAREGPGACYRLWSQVYVTPSLTASPGLRPSLHTERRAARTDEAASKTDVTILSQPRNASSAPSCFTLSLRRSISLVV
jgi:hypothetical protein